MRIYILRHGHNDWLDNSEIPEYPENIIIPLNSKGKEQAVITGEFLKKHMKSKQFDAIITSPIKRAEETAEIVAEELNYNKDMFVDNRIRELSTGDFGGKKYDDPIYKKCIVEYLKFLRKNNNDLINARMHYDKLCEEYHKKFKIESKKEVDERICSFLNDLTKQDKFKNVLVVSHGNAIKTMLKHMFGGLPPPGGATCSLTMVEWKNGKFIMHYPTSNLHLTHNFKCLTTPT